jgi:DNA-binding Lrp family transcriptional regulator
MKKGKKFELSHIIQRLKEGKKAKEISKELEISKSNLSYYLDKLKKEGIVEYKGSGVWLVQKTLPTRKFKKRHCRGHAFIWKIELGRKIDWKKHIEKSNISFKEQSNNKVLRIILNSKKIWLTSKGLIIYEPKDFFGENSYISKGKAVFEMDRTIKQLFNKLGLSLISYKFKTSREHFGLIKNELARQYNDKGEKLHIVSENGKEWMWIDDSLSLGELETNEMNINKSLQDFWNDNKKHNFKVTPTFVLNSINQVTQNQLMFNQNFESHVEAIQTLSSKVKELSEVIKDLQLNKGNKHL